MNPRIKVMGPTLGMMLAIIAIIITLSFHENRAAAIEPSLTNTVAPSCRAGVTAHAREHIVWIDEVGAGWYVYFGVYPETVARGADIAPVISVKQDKNGAQYLDTYTINPSLESLEPRILSRPGTLWIVGNEVDRGPNPGETTGGQGDTYPDVYARAYNEIYHFIM